MSQEQIDFYNDNGLLVLEKRIPDATMDAIRAEITRFTDLARGMTASDDRIDLEDSHKPDAPRSNGTRPGRSTHTPMTTCSRSA